MKSLVMVSGPFSVLPYPYSLLYVFRHLCGFLPPLPVFEINVKLRGAALVCSFSSTKASPLIGNKLKLVGGGGGGSITDSPLALYICIFLYHHWEFTSINGPLSYHFRSLVFGLFGISGY